MTRIVLINGAPGSGKSTIAQLLSQGIPMALALDVDVLKHAIGQWEVDPTGAGLQARLLALAVIDAHVSAGHDVFVGQYLARTEFIEQLDNLAASRGALFFELVLDVDEGTLMSRLAHRAACPDRPEHAVNARLVAPSDVPGLLRSLEGLQDLRPGVLSVDASGTPAETASRIHRLLDDRA